MMARGSGKIVLGGSMGGIIPVYGYTLPHADLAMECAYRRYVTKLIPASK
jgi:hypothetical protein